MTHLATGGLAVTDNSAALAAADTYAVVGAASHYTTPAPWRQRMLSRSHPRTRRACGMWSGMYSGRWWTGTWWWMCRLSWG